MDLRHCTARWASFLAATCVACTSAESSRGPDAASEDGSASVTDAGPAVFDGGGPVVIGEDDAAMSSPPACAPGPPTTTTNFCTAPVETLACPSCAPAGYSCEAGAGPSEVIVAGGTCYAVGGGSCCTLAECTQTAAFNDACADGGLAYYCPSGASGGTLGLRCAPPDASTPSFACCFF